MVHPRDLLRTNSDTASRFSAPIEALSSTPVDCGLSAFPCLNRWFNLERCAKASVFLFVLGHIGMIQNAISSFVQGTSIIWMQEYGLSRELVDWILCSRNIFAGIVALTVAYWGNAIHRASWIGAITMFNAICCITLIVPEIFDPFTGDFYKGDDTDVLCSASDAFNNSSSINATDENSINEIAVGALFLHQIFSSLGMIAIHTLGISYLDDNVDIFYGPIYIAGALALKEMGEQIGMYLSWTAIKSTSLGVFLAPAFLVLSSLLFVFGIVIAMFPQRLPYTLLKQAVASIVDIANGIEPHREEKSKDGFFTTVWRILRNKVLVLNAFAATFTWAAILNFEFFRSSFYQSNFYLPIRKFDSSGYNDPWLSQIITNLLKVPFIAICIVVAGLVISKFKPTAKKLSISNCMSVGMAIIAFGVLIFYNCDKSLQTELRSRITVPFCSGRCSCSEDIPFTPVCTETGQMTYFSPCHAGCSTIENINSIKIFGNCTCGDNIYLIINNKATEGSCNKSCLYLWGLAQVNAVSVAGILAATLFMTLIISLRVVEPEDKSAALGLHLTFLGIVPYIPFRIVYIYIADYLCQVRTTDGLCRLNSSYFGIFLPAATVTLLVIAMIFFILVVLSVEKVDLFEVQRNKDDGNVSDEEIEELETRRDHGGTENLFRTSSPASGGNQETRLRDFNDASAKDIKTKLPSESVTEMPEESDHLLNQSERSENQNTTEQATENGFPIGNRNSAKAEIHTTGKYNENESHPSTDVEIPKRNENKTGAQLLESNF